MTGPALLIDTSTRHLVFARVAEKGALIVKTADRGEDTLDTAVEQLFPEGGIGEIWLGEGPGSFVGLRSSFAYARMLSMLTQVPCRTFLSSRLWRSFFGVAASDWFLMRTNARLYYAERYAPQREAEAVDVEAAARLTGDKFCFIDSWLASQGKESTEEGNPPWKTLRFEDARIPAGIYNARNSAAHRAGSTYRTCSTLRARTQFRQGR